MPAFRIMGGVVAGTAIARDGVNAIDRRSTGLLE